MKDYLRHPNGRGIIRGDAQCNRGAYISRDSEVRGRAVVRDACLEGRCVVEDGAILLGGYFFNTYVGAGTWKGGPSPTVAGGGFENCHLTGGLVVAGQPNATDSTLACRRISGTPTVDRCQLLNTVELFDGPVLEDIVARGAAWLYGDCVLRGPFEVGGMTRINRGSWERPPRSISFGGVDLTEAPGGAMLDCRFGTFDYWSRHGRNLAKKRVGVIGHLPDELVDDVLAVVAEWQREQGVMTDAV
jgi:hypothetical protein